MVSGFLISPYDHERILSGLAIEMRIWSKTCAGTCGLKRFMTSWFMYSLRLRTFLEDRDGRPAADHPRLSGPSPLLRHPSPDHSAASAAPGPPPRSCLELCRSTLRPSE